MQSLYVDLTVFKHVKQFKKICFFIVIKLSSMVAVEFTEINIVHCVRLEKFNNFKNMKELWLFFEKILVKPTMKALHFI